MNYKAVEVSQTIKWYNHHARVAIEIDIKPLNGHPSNMSIHLAKDSFFNEAACNAAEYFLDHYQEDNNVAIDLAIGRIWCLPLETSATLVFYAMVCALCECANFCIEGFSLDTQSGVLHLPLPRAGGSKPNVSVVIE